MIRTAFATSLLFVLPLVTPADDYLADLLSDSAKRRAAAVVALKAKPDEAKSVARALVRVASGTDPRAAGLAVDALHEIGPDARDALPALKELTKTRKADWRLAGAMLAVGGAADKDVVRYALPVRSIKANTPYFDVYVIDRHPAELVGPLAEILATDPDPAVRADAARALGCYATSMRRVGGPPLERAGEAGKKVAPALVAALGDAAVPVRREAALSLTAVDPDAIGRALPTVVALLKQGHLTSHQTAQAMRQSVAAAVPVLVAALAGSDDDSRERIASVLAEFREPALPLLVPSMKHADAGVRRGVARALGVMWGAGEAVVPPLVEALADADRDVRLIAAEGLSMGQKSKAAASVPVLLEALKRDTASVRVRAAFGLRAVGAAAKPAVPALTELLRDRSSQVALAAGRALAVIDPAAAAPAVPVMAEHGLVESNKARLMVAEELGQLGPTAAAALPKLKPLLADPDPLMRATVAMAVVRIDPALTPDAVTVLTGLLTPNPKRLLLADRVAMKHLRQIGPAAKAAVPALSTRLVGLNEDYQFQVAATILAIDRSHGTALELLRAPLATADADKFDDVARHIRGLGPAAVGLVPDLIPFVTHPNVSVRSDAADILTDIGPTAKDALPALRAQLAREPKKEVKERLIRAIRAITGAA